MLEVFGNFVEWYGTIAVLGAYGLTMFHVIPFQGSMFYILNLSGEERYIQFSKSFPDFVQRVPQYMLASFLGFTPEFLSKVRAKRG